MISISALVTEAMDEVSAETLSDPVAAQAFVKRMYARLGDDASATLKRRLTKRLAALGRSWKVSLPLPRYVKPLRQEQPTRRADWPPKANRVLAAGECLERILPDRHGNADVFADRALASAILRCGLLRPQTWGPFRQAVSSGTGLRRIKDKPELAWIDLDIPRQAGRSAQSKDTETIRLFPDTETLGLMARATGAKPMPRSKPKELLTRAMASIGASNVGLSVEDVCAAGFAALEDAAAHPIPAVLFEVARGTLPAFAVPQDVWLAHLSDVEPDPLQLQDPSETPETKPREPVPPATMTTQLSLARLFGAVMVIGEQARKPTRAPVIAALEALLEAGPVPFVRGVALWLLDLLARKRAVGTIRRYLAAVRLVCERMDTEDPVTLKAGAIEVRLEETLELATKTDRLYRAGRLMQLFGFAQADPRLRWPRIMLVVEGEDKPCVRAALTGPKEIAAALAAFEADPVSRAAVLLGARGGLRLSDMEALRIGDVETGADGMVRIHHTIWKSLKTPSARRMVPLALLLTPEEQEIWTGFLTQRLHEANPDAPLLAEGGEIIPLKLFDRSAFAATLGDKTGLRPHDLRHGAISNLALMLLSPPDAAPIIRHMTGWDETQQADLRDVLTASDPWRGMKELAKIAGHFDPATTLESYVHICDLALGLHLQASAAPLPVDDAARRIGTYPKMFGSKKIITPAVLRQMVLDRMGVTATDVAPVAEIVAAPAQPLGIDLIVRIEAAFVSGLDTIKIGEMFQLPTRVINVVATSERIGRLRAEADHIAAKQLAERVFAAPEAFQWAKATLASKKGGMVFRTPAQAQRWLEPLTDILAFKAELRTQRHDKWSTLSFPTKLLPNTRKVSECLTVVPVSPDGVLGMGLCRSAASMVLALIAAREAQELGVMI